ncbi:transmembrane protein 272-like isoform X2 [Eleutherodactylus coqui]|uniref:transmembrane protein 272-like isoform X2 n=1 Tax=Eleutherodactylus coqui TaxID=57060 RepID=UPI0034620A3A
MGLTFIRGVMYQNKCPLQPLISTYLIVAGVSQLLAIILQLLKLLCHQVSAVLEGFILLFIFGWLIAGSVWVFSIYFVYPALCSSVLYRFSFGVLVFQYIFFAIFSVTLVLVTCVNRFKSLTKAFLI